MTRTEEMEFLKSELFRIRLAMQLSLRKLELYEKYKEELVIVRRRMARLKYEELLEQKENEERGMKNGKF